MDRDDSTKDAQKSPGDSGTLASPDAGTPPVSIPDHVLLRPIGSGSYGQVWLARNTMGRYRAVKIVHRGSFRNHRPFERELSGIRKFEPVSRSHDGFVDVLHVGINEEQGYFFYIMELGDDPASGQKIDPAAYSPKTLAGEIAARGRLSLQECLQLGLVLSDALAELHRHGLVHRDIKPSNIIFVNGVPKLADIGLVAEVHEARSYVGTEGFIPPEGPGNPRADIYSLGKVLYEASTGRDRQEFPALPAEFDRSEDHHRFLELNEVILQACDDEADRRYATATAMRADLAGLAAGKSVKRMRLERRLTWLKRAAAVALVATGVFATASYLNRDRLISLTSFDPQSGPAGTVVTITGTNFNPKPHQNVVRFGTARAEVISADQNQLVVRVPPGATYAPVAVTARGLTACTMKPFSLTFAEGGSLDFQSFEPPVLLDVGNGPFQVALGDIDGDATQDLVVVHTYDGNARVFRNIGPRGSLTTNSFAPPAILEVGGSPDGLQDVVLADVDSDGDLDIVTSNLGKNKVSIFENRCVAGSITASSFGRRLDLFCGTGPRGLAVRDLDDDNKPDLIIANYGSDTISILPNRSRPGKIALARHFQLEPGTFASALAVEDLDQDGKPDIAVAGGRAGIALFRNVGKPGKLSQDSFAQKVDLPGGAESLAVGDLDRDGKPDIVAGFYLGLIMSIQRNTTTPGGFTSNSFSPPVIFEVQSRVHHVAIGNLDGDGRPDIALAMEVRSKWSFFQNLSSPGTLSRDSFGPRVDFFGGSNICGIAIGDLDGDGRPEVVHGDAYKDRVHVHRQRSHP